jgi:signal transduction histidine kinase
MSARARSVQWRILLRQLPLLALVFFAVLYWFGEHLRGLLYEADLEVARQTSRLTVAAVEASMESARTHEAWSRVLTQVPMREGSLVEVLTADGRVLFATDPGLIGTAFDLNDSPCIVCHEDGSTGAKADQAFIRDTDETPFQVFAAPLRNTAACRRCHGEDERKLGMVYVHRSVEPLHRRVGRIQFALAVAGLVALLLAVVTTRLLLGRYLGRPLRTLADGARRIGEGDLDPDVRLPERTELSLLADTLNNSAARLREMVGTLQRQRDDSQALYRMADQLSRAVTPESRRRRCVKLASRVLKKDCVLIRPGPRGGSGISGSIATFQGPDGGIAEVTLKEESSVRSLFSFCDATLLEEWLAGGFEGELEFRRGATVAYTLRHQGRRLGLLMTMAGDFTSTDQTPDPGTIDALLKHLGTALAYSDHQREMIAGERLAAIGETVAGLAHCLKNVLNGLRAGLYVTNRALELEDDEKLENGWRVLTNSVGQVERLTFDMLYYIKERTPRREPVDVSAVIAEVVEVLREEAGRKGVEIREDAGPAVGEVALDRTAVFRALLNLATNAVDACAESETGDLVRIACESSEEEFVLSVSDNGIGMSRAVLDRLFTRFFSTKSSRGTGLGLTVVRKIAREHGGDLEIETAEDVGTTVRMRLPIVDPE